MNPVPRGTPGIPDSVVIAISQMQDVIRALESRVSQLEQQLRSGR